MIADEEAIYLLWLEESPDDGCVRGSHHTPWVQDTRHRWNWNRALSLRGQFVTSLQNYSISVATSKCTVVDPPTWGWHAEDAPDGSLLPVQGETDAPQGGEARALSLQLLVHRWSPVVLVHCLLHLTVTHKNDLRFFSLTRKKDWFSWLALLFGDSNKARSTLHDRKGTKFFDFGCVQLQGIMDEKLKTMSPGFKSSVSPFRIVFKKNTCVSQTSRNPTIQWKKLSCCDLPLCSNDVLQKEEKRNVLNNSNK